MARSDAEVAIELRAKFEFYLLGLAFTILGLSIQTATFGTSTVADFFELIGWFALFLAGIVGLLRGEWIPVAHAIQSKIHFTETRISEITRALEARIDQPITFIEDDGREVALNVAEAVAKLRAVLTELERQRKSAERKILIRYRWMKYSFLVGVAALMVARAYPNARNVAEVICTCFR